MCPSGGNMKIAIILNRKIVDMEYATSISVASIIGAIEAIADPPQTAVPTPIKDFKFVGILSNLPNPYADRKAVESVNIIIYNESTPVLQT